MCVEGNGFFLEEFKLKNLHNDSLLLSCNQVVKTFNRVLLQYINGVQGTRISVDDSRSAGQEIPNLLCKPNAHFLVQNCQPLDPIRGQLNPFYIPELCCIKFDVVILLL